MKTYMGIAAALAMIAGIGIANADEASGKIKSVSQGDRTMVLEDGTKFTVGDNVEIDDLEAGMDVTIEYEMEDDDNVASQVNEKES